MNKDNRDFSKIKYNKHSELSDKDSDSDSDSDTGSIEINKKVPKKTLLNKIKKMISIK